MSLRARARRELGRVPGALALARLTVETIRVCLRYRVTGLASEAGFFMLLSLPPLLLGLFGGVGYVGQWLGRQTVDQISGGIQTWAERFLTDTLINEALLPTVDDVLGAGRFDLISVGFLLSIWSGSRALNVFVDTISIMYGQSGVRGIVRTRALSLSLYLLGLVVGIIVIPLVLIGPTWLGQLLPDHLEFLSWLYWPVVTFLAVASLATLYHVSTPRRSPWLRDLPGAVLTLVIWSLSSYVLRGTIEASLGGPSIYGPLSTPIVLLIWLYFLAIAILIGAAMNAAMRVLWPVRERPSSRAKAVSWLKQYVATRRRARAAAGTGAAPSGVGGRAGAATGGGAGAATGGGAGAATGGGAEAWLGIEDDPAAQDGQIASTAERQARAGARAATAQGASADARPGKEMRPLTPMPEKPRRRTRRTKERRKEGVREGEAGSGQVLGADAVADGEPGEEVASAAESGAGPVTDADRVTDGMPVAAQAGRRGPAAAGSPSPKWRRASKR